MAYHYFVSALCLFLYSTACCYVATVLQMMWVWVIRECTSYIHLVWKDGEWKEIFSYYSLFVLVVCGVLLCRLRLRCERGFAISIFQHIIHHQLAFSISFYYYCRYHTHSSFLLSFKKSTSFYFLAHETTDNEKMSLMELRGLEVRADIDFTAFHLSLSFLLSPWWLSWR